jgi:acetyl esterase
MVSDRATAPMWRQVSGNGRVAGRRHPNLEKPGVAAVKAATRLGTRLLPVVPDGGKRLLMGGRSITVDGNTLDPTLRVMLATQKLGGQDRLAVGDDPLIARQRLRAVTGILNRNSVTVGGVTTVSIPGPAGPIPARHYRPDSDRRAPLMVFYHGGGWVIGDPDTHDGLCRLICSGAGIHVLSVHYRLAPEHPAPAGVDDAYAAFQWALQHSGELGAEPGRVLVGGDSAGGNISAVVAQRGRDDGAAPVLQLLLYPATDMRGGTRSRALFAEGYLLTRKDMDFFEHHYLSRSDLDASNPRISPVLADDLSGLAPAIVVTAGFDPLRDEGEQYAAAMRDAGTIVDLRRFGSLTHGFANLSSLGGGSRIAVAEIVSALRAHLCHQ